MVRNADSGEEGLHPAQEDPLSLRQTAAVVLDDDSSAPDHAAPDLSSLWAKHPPSIGHYIIEGVVGSGGYGTVYRGIHRWLRVPGAIKVIQSNDPTREWTEFRREAQRQARLQAHPGIAQVRDFGFFTDARTNARHPYYVMDLIPGNQTITAYANRQGLSLAERLSLFAKVCDAVHYAHQRGILHLDLKPANLLVYPPSDGKPAQPKVIDFGIARAADPAMDAYVRDDITGTVAYMSPEHTDPAATLDVRSDVYSLGVVLYELLCGQWPYQLPEKAGREAFSIIRNTPPDMSTPEAEALPSAVKDMILKALAKRPADRYATAAALATDLRQYLGGGVPDASGGGIFSSGWSRLRHAMMGRPWLAAAIIILATIAVTHWIGVPLVYRWTGANRWFENRLAAASPLEQFTSTVVIGQTEKTNAAGALRGQGEVREDFARLLQQLNAVRPEAVVFTYAFPGAKSHDEPLASAIRGLVSRGTPVLVAVNSEEIEAADGLPPEASLSKAIAREVSGWGEGRLRGWKAGSTQFAESFFALRVAPDPPERQSLALASVVAARAPGLKPGYTLEPSSQMVRVGFFTAGSAPGARPMRSGRADLLFPVTSIHPDSDAPGWTNAEVRLAPPTQAACDNALIEMESVLTGDPAALARCDRRIVIIGNVSATPIQTQVGPRPAPFLHAAAIEAILGSIPGMPGPLETLLIPAAGALAGLILPLPVIRRRAWWPSWAVWGTAALWALAFGCVVALALLAARDARLLFNPLVPIFAMLVAAALALALNTMRKRYPLNPEVSQ